LFVKINNFLRFEIYHYISDDWDGLLRFLIDLVCRILLYPRVFLIFKISSMNKKWKFFEKFISIINLIVGFSIIEFLILMGIPIFSEIALSTKILSVLAITGGSLLLFQKRLGWIIRAGSFFLSSSS